MKKHYRYLIQYNIKNVTNIYQTWKEHRTNDWDIAQRYLKKGSARLFENCFFLKESDTWCHGQFWKRVESF